MRGLGFRTKWIQIARWASSKIYQICRILRRKAWTSLSLTFHFSEFLSLSASQLVCRSNSFLKLLLQAGNSNKLHKFDHQSWPNMEHTPPIPHLQSRPNSHQGSPIHHCTLQSCSCTKAYAAPTALQDPSPYCTSILTLVPAQNWQCSKRRKLFGPWLDRWSQIHQCCSNRILKGHQSQG